VVMLSRIATRDELARLGLEGYDLGQIVQLPLPSSEVSHALGRGDVAAWSFAAMLAAKFINVPLTSVVHPVLGGVKLDVSQSPSRVVKVSAPFGSPFEIRALKGVLQEGKSIYTPPEDTGTAYVDVAEVPVLLIRTGPAGIALSASGTNLELAELVKPLELVQPAHLEPPVMEWVAGSNDSWLRDEVAAKVGAHNSWSRVVAAGMVARLTGPSSSEEAREWVRRFTTGEVDEKLAAPRRWARSLRSHESRTVEELALAEVDGLHSDVEAFVVAVDSGAEGWEEMWRDLCGRRDDLECVLLLLDESGQSARLRGALASLDRDGDLARLTIPAQTEVADERMWRASRKTPGSWWGALPAAS
jgi:hypothetical protein